MILQFGAASRAEGDSMPGPSVESHLGLMVTFIKRSLAPRTWAEYESAWKVWSGFCASINVEPLCVSLSSALLFVSDLFNQGMGFSSLSKTLAGVSFFLKLSGCATLTSYPPVRQMMNGLKKGSMVADRRRPITSEVLGELLRALRHCCSSYYEFILFRTAFVLAFFGALRIGELVAVNKASTAPLGYSDVVLGDGSVSLLIRRSKTDIRAFLHILGPEEGRKKSLY